MGVSIIDRLNQVIRIAIRTHKIRENHLNDIISIFIDSNNDVINLKNETINIAAKGTIRAVNMILFVNRVISSVIDNIELEINKANAPRGLRSMTKSNPIDPQFTHTIATREVMQRNKYKPIQLYDNKAIVFFMITSKLVWWV